MLHKAKVGHPLMIHRRSTYLLIVLHPVALPVQHYREVEHRKFLILLPHCQICLRRQETSDVNPGAQIDR